MRSLSPASLAWNRKYSYWPRPCAVCVRESAACTRNGRKGRNTCTVYRSVDRSRTWGISRQVRRHFAAGCRTVRSVKPGASLPSAKGAAQKYCRVLPAIVPVSAALVLRCGPGSRVVGIFYRTRKGTPSICPTLSRLSPVPATDKAVLPGARCDPVNCISAIRVLPSGCVSHGRRSVCLTITGMDFFGF